MSRFAANEWITIGDSVDDRFVRDAAILNATLAGKLITAKVVPAMASKIIVKIAKKRAT